MSTPKTTAFRLKTGAPQMRAIRTVFINAARENKEIMALMEKTLSHEGATRLMLPTPIQYIGDMEQQKIYA